MRRPAPRRRPASRAGTAGKARREAVRVMAGLWVVVILLWLGIDTTSAMALRGKLRDLPPLAIGAGTVIGDLGQVECLALSSPVWGPLFPQARRVALPAGVVVERARCVGHGPGSRSVGSTVRLVRIE